MNDQDQQVPKGASQKFVDVKEIRDGVLILKDGSLRAVLIASSINFALKAQEEQNAIIYAFQQFLNGLDFSLEIVIHSRRLDIAPYIKYLEELLDAQKTELLRLQTQDYIQFVRGFTELQNVMSKAFYVVVPMARKPAEKLTSPGGLKTFFGKKKTAGQSSLSDEEFNHLDEQLNLRVEQVLGSLRAMTIESRQLDSEELFYLLANLYSPGVLKKQIPISTAIEGFR